MEYKQLIDPELRQIAKKIPYNRVIIRCANIYQSISFKLSAMLKGVDGRTIMIVGHRDLPLKVAIFEPSNAKGKLPCLIYVHGGAFSYRAAAYHKKLACMYALKTKCRVFFPDYHLTPKYPYPAAYEDVLALYRYITENADEYQINVEQIGIGGDSAGGTIAALICNNYERENLKRPCLQMLVYPLTDDDMATDSMKKYADAPIWNLKNHKKMWRYYFKDQKNANSPETLPMHSNLPQIIPETYIETAEYDCLHDEGVLYGKKLRDAGANIEMNETRGTIHGYDSAINTKIAHCNINKRILFLQRGFNT